MTQDNRRVSRRNFALAAASAALLVGCGNGIGSKGSQRIDGRVDATLDYMYQTYPATRQLSNNAAGMLVMPLVTEAGFGFGAGFGRGALQVQGQTVDYYSAATASAGIQVGAQQYSHVLFFMTPEALNEFRRSAGWELGANAEYVLVDKGDTLRADTTSTFKPVVAVVFAQAGFRVGATLDGVKYTRIIP